MEILDRKTVWQGHLVDIEKVHVRLPNGKERDYELVNHADAVTILPVDHEGNIYFVEQYRVGAQQKVLELPAGVIDDGEEPEIAAQRELREETGMASGDMRKLSSFYMIAGYGDEFMTGYLALELYPAPLAQDDDEFLNLIKMPIIEVYKKLYANGFNDSKTIVLLSLAIPQLLEKFPELHQSFKQT